jgi:hypothetical protein
LFQAVIFAQPEQKHGPQRRVKVRRMAESFGCFMASLILLDTVLQQLNMDGAIRIGDLSGTQFAASSSRPAD